MKIRLITLHFFYLKIAPIFSFENTQMIKEVTVIHLFVAVHPLSSILTVNSYLCQINLYNKGFREGLDEEERGSENCGGHFPSSLQC